MSIVPTYHAVGERLFGSRLLQEAHLQVTLQGVLSRRGHGTADTPRLRQEAGDTPDPGSEADVHQRFSTAHCTHPVLESDCRSLADIVLQMLEAVRQIAHIFLDLLEVAAVALLGLLEREHKR